MWAIMLFPVSPEFFHVRPFKHLLFHSFQVIRKKYGCETRWSEKKMCIHIYDICKYVIIIARICCKMFGLLRHVPLCSFEDWFLDECFDPCFVNWNWFLGSMGIGSQ
jgi:hypothetical protein